MSPNVVVTILIGVGVASGAMLWQSFSSAYQEIEKTTDLAPLVSKLQQINENKIKKLSAETDDGQGGIIGESSEEQRMVSGNIYLPKDVERSDSAVYVALIDDSKQDIASKVVNGQIITKSELSSENVIQYSIPIEVEQSKAKLYSIFVFLDIEKDGINSEYDPVTKISLENITTDRINYFDVNLK
ncbi:MAG: hypothetical protein GWN01_03660 [Nitrosopumilaceae archaeon]|nr:hypothetical protein [Nitrosopumilaceae archaeon]NIU00054.1 hypothetical protein [Nitrosopumilaceae archaeon]NIU86433.1 hypothetical protein [Nitrosopumilaceae archaeon]NIV65142.1 hypothetical protein [Nitrosopumilaceae archaeon]NIX60656.1 hypothetical protein [Nitrosopumilaceae archaeon]